MYEAFCACASHFHFLKPAVIHDSFKSLRLFRNYGTTQLTKEPSKNGRLVTAWQPLDNTLSNVPQGMLRCGKHSIFKVLGRTCVHNSGTETPATHGVVESISARFDKFSHQPACFVFVVGMLKSPKHCLIDSKKTRQIFWNILARGHPSVLRCCRSGNIQHDCIFGR